ncbi:MAG: diguanylate cyclase, partial [Thiohalophilus sp.]
MKQYWYSLRFRFLVGAGVILILVLGGAFWAYQNIQELRHTVAENLQIQRYLNNTARKIRVHLLDSSIHIEAYLLDPSAKHHRDRTFNSIEAAILLTRKMNEQSPDILGEQHRQLDLLEKDLAQLTQKASHVFEVRDDANQQFPSLAVGNDIMQPNRDNLNNALALAFTEMHEEGRLVSSPSAYRQLDDIRHLWTQLLSNFRLYLANRVGSFNEQALPIQEKAIHTMHAELKEQISNLRKMDQEGKLGFQTSIALTDIYNSLEGWYQGYIQVEQIHRSDEWRIDSKIMKDDIVPLLDTMSSRLTEIENRIGEATTEDVEMLTAATQRQTVLLFWVIGGILLIMLIVFWSINHMVFRPLAMVVKALKAEASGMEMVLLPESHSQETAALVESFNEMAKQVRKRQSDLEYQALHDSLTGLPNRTLLQERIEYDIQMAERGNSTVSLLMLDIDRFKEVNDTLGHHIGDRLLIHIGKRLRGALREVDTVARLGGDEFAVVLNNANEEMANKVARKILDAMEETITVDQYQLYVSLSIGVAIYPQHGDDAVALLQHADVAMYNAKQNQVGSTIYAPDEDNYSLMRLEMINELREAIEKDRLELHFHPILDVKKNRPYGVECLLRWNHPRFDKISPQKTVELAEHTGLIHALTYWVLETALRELHKLHEDGYSLALAVNISANNLKDSEFYGKVESLLEQYTIPEGSLIFEITESAMMANPLRATELLKQLDELGIKLAVDDYGTGFSSLAYLKQLP